MKQLYTLHLILFLLLMVEKSSAIKVIDRETFNPEIRWSNLSAGRAFDKTRFSKASHDIYVGVKDKTFMLSDIRDNLITNLNNDLNNKLYSNLNIYPNPGWDFVTIEFEINPEISSVNLEMVTFKGSIIYQEDIKQQKTVSRKTIDISTLKNGVYYIRLDGKVVEPLIIAR